MVLSDDCRTPGQLIKRLLDERDWNQRSLAPILGVEETGLSKVINGSRPVTAELALILGETFEVDPELFLGLQQSYDLAKARITSQPDPKRANRARLFGDLPVADMVRRRWLGVESVRNVPRVESALIKFFEADSLDQIEILPHAARKTVITSEATPAQIAWIYRVRQLARQVPAAQYTPFAGRSVIKKLEALLYNVADIRQVPRLLGESGIRFVICETLDSAKIDGVCFWIDSKTPVIGMTLRYDRIDNFWFVLRHEIEHMIRTHGRGGTVLDAELQGADSKPDVSDEERVANAAAADFGITRETIAKFISRKAPFFTEFDLLGIAETYKVHPGIVAGRVQHEMGRYDLFRNHLAKVRQHILPNAIVIDGWGNYVMSS